MKRYLLSLSILFVIPIGLPQGKSVHITRLKGQMAPARSHAVDRIGRNLALLVAKEALRRSGKSPKRYDATLCELRDFWLVIFESKGFARSGPEYAITKEG